MSDIKALAARIDPHGESIIKVFKAIASHEDRAAKLQDKLKDEVIALRADFADDNEYLLAAEQVFGNGRPAKDPKWIGGLVYESMRDRWAGTVKQHGLMARKVAMALSRGGNLNTADGMLALKDCSLSKAYKALSKGTGTPKGAEAKKTTAPSAPVSESEVAATIRGMISGNMAYTLAAMREVSLALSALKQTIEAEAITAAARNITARVKS